MPQAFTIDGNTYVLTDGSWVNDNTFIRPPLKICHRLNRMFLDSESKAEFEAWGREHLLRFHFYLQQFGATKQDYERLGLEFLFQEMIPWQESPLHALGYRVGKSGMNKQERRNVLRRALTEHLPMIQSTEYMAHWGLPGTDERRMKVIGHIRTIKEVRRGDGDYSQATLEWNEDLDWLERWQSGYEPRRTENFDDELEKRLNHEFEKQRIGCEGEKFILHSERAKLANAGRDDLAQRVIWIARVDDEAGYDIMSFTESGKPIHIEVKTTKNGKHDTEVFWLSENECQHAATDEYWTIYRVWNVYDGPFYENLGNIICSPDTTWQRRPSSWIVGRCVG